MQFRPWGGCTRWQQQQQHKFQPVPEDELSNAVEDIKLEDVADFSQFPLTTIKYQDIIDQINRRLATEPSVMVWINKMAIPPKPQHWLKEKMKAPTNTVLAGFLNSYVRSYDQRSRIPFWTFEWLTEDMFGKENRSSNYPVDEEQHPFFRSHLNDFKGTEFDCGHSNSMCREVHVLRNLFFGKFPADQINACQRSTMFLVLI
ncbi:hypothetical protein quinque_010317 [Culex quinquefasciatus]